MKSSYCIQHLSEYVFWDLVFGCADVFPSPGLAWQAVLKKTKSKLHLLTDIDMLLMVEKYVSGGTWDAINRYVNANNKHINNWYGWAMSQKLPMSGFKWVENTFQFNKDFIQNYNDDSDKSYFLEVSIQYPEKLYDLHNDLPLLPERMKVEKVEKHEANLHDKK